MPPAVSAAAPSRSRVLLELYRTFGPHLRPYWRWFAVGYTTMAGAVFLKTLAPFPLKWILDFVLLEKPLPEEGPTHWLGVLGSEPETLLGVLCAAMVVLVFLNGSLSYFYRYLIAAAARLANNDIRNHVFHRLQQLPLSFHGKVSPGDLVVRLTEDVNTLRALLIDSVTDLLRMGFGFAWVIVLMLSMDAQLTLLALAIAPPIYWITSRFRGSVEKLTKVTRTKESEVGAVVQENISSMAVVHAFSQQGHERARFEETTQASLVADIRRMQLSRGFGRVIELVVALGTAGVVYYAGRLALVDRLEPTDLVLFVPWLQQLYEPLQRLAQLLIKLSRQTVSGERIAELLRVEVTVRDAEDAIEAPDFAGDIEFDSVSFGYRPDVPVLQEVSFRAKPGQMIALVGSSGAGKSTVVNLLLRFFDPWQGSIRIDGTDIRRFKLESLRDRMNVVLQDTLLLRRSIRDNIAFGRPDATQEDVEVAARAAQIHDFVAALPDGYDTPLTDRAADISGGQRQRLALARAILRESPILILDEPVSAVDAITEARLDETIARVTKGRTALIIAHRLSTVRRADLILVIEEGRIAEHGTHEQLMSDSRLYRELYETQYRQPIEEQEQRAGT